MLIGATDNFDHQIMRRMISEVDENSDNKIDFSEFKRMLLLIFDKLQEYKDVE